MDLKELTDCIYEEVLRELQERDEKVSEWAKTVICTYATPRIKGEITKGKLKWRGIKLTRVWNSCNFEETYTITQRGKQLGEFVITFENESIWQKS